MEKKYTCSAHNGSRFSQRHNCNKEFRNNEPHIDKNREIIVLEYESIRDFYQRFFQEYVDDYNAKQKRKDRIIEDYYQSVLTNKKLKPAYELIVQVGNIDSRPNEETCISIMKEFYHTWKERNPNFEIISAAIHLDEKTPHMHIDYVPISYKNSRGLEVQIGLEKALNEMGYKSEKYHDTAQIKWEREQLSELIQICNSYGIVIENPKNIGAKHLEKEDYISKKIIDKEKQMNEMEIEINNKKNQMQYIDEELENKIQNANQKIIYINDYIQQKASSANQQIKAIKSEYENKIIEYKSEYNSRLKQVDIDVKNRLDEVQKQYDEKILEYRNKFENAKGAYNNMCLKYNDKKKEYEKYIDKDTHSIVCDIMTMGKDTFGNKRVYTEQEVSTLIENAKAIEVQNKEIQNIKKNYVEMEKNYATQVDTQNRIIQELHDNIIKLQDKNTKLELCQNYIQESGNIIDFNNYAKGKKIIQEKVFDYDASEARTHYFMQNKIVDIRNYKKKEIDDNAPTKEKENYQGLEL